MATKREKNKKRILRKLLISAAAVAIVAAGVFALLYFVRPFGLDVFHTAPTPTPTLEPAAPALTAAPITSPTVEPATPAPTAEPIRYQRSLYEATLDIDPQSMTVHGKLRLTYVSPYEEPLYSVELNLYPNAIAFGSLKVNNVTLNGVDVYYASYNNDVALIIPLAQELYKGDSAVIYIDYTITLPETSNRFGYGKDSIMLGHSLPIASLYENGAWRRENYMSIGDCFLNEIADYKVVAALPENWAMLSTGTVTEQRTDNGVTTYLIDAPQVREFALGAQKNAKLAAITTDSGVEVSCLARSDAQALFGAEAAKNALEFYSARIGNYPYTRLCVVQFGDFSGMEYPGFVMISEEMFDKYKDTGEYVIAHEVAHQWFYAVTGSDSIRQPWLDESIVEFLCADYFLRTGAQEKYQTIIGQNDAALEGYDRTVRLDATLAEFNYSADDYAKVVYSYGSYVYRELMEEIGEEAFYAALADYYNSHRFAQSSKEELIAAFSTAAGRDLTDWFENMLRVK